MFDWYWVFLFYIFILHIKSIIFSLYVHRGYMHNSIEFTKVGNEIFKFLSWTTHDFIREEFKYIPRAIHMKHHANSDTARDPHSPYYYSLYTTIIKNVTAPSDNPAGPYYITPDELNKYRKDSGLVDTWIDINFYERFKRIGVLVWYPLIFFLYGPIGLINGIVIMPLLIFDNFATTVFNYLFHKIGYRVQGGNKGSDQSRNVFPIAIWLGGEELHSNHHSSPSRAKLSMRWFEFDMGWVYIRILSFFGLVRIKKQPNN